MSRSHRLEATPEQQREHFDEEARRGAQPRPGFIPRDADAEETSMGAALRGEADDADAPSAPDVPADDGESEG